MRQRTDDAPEQLRGAALSSSGQPGLETPLRLPLAQAAGPASVLRASRDSGPHEMNVRPVREEVARLCRPELEAR
jgi:hypothetical protein